MEDREIRTALDRHWTASDASDIMEFKDGKVARETQYFGDAFEPGPSRVQWVERMA